MYIYIYYLIILFFLACIELILLSRKFKISNTDIPTYESHHIESSKPNLVCTSIEMLVTKCTWKLLICANTFDK